MINLEQPPANLPPELRSYLVRMFTQVSNHLAKSVTLPISNQEIHKPVKGQLFYFTAAFPTSGINTPGVHYYDGTVWVFIA